MTKHKHTWEPAGLGYVRCSLCGRRMRASVLDTLVRARQTWKTVAQTRQPAQQTEARGCRFGNVHGQNRWCGPGAISILTGWSTDVAARHIRAISGQVMVKSSYLPDLLIVLRRQAKLTLDEVPALGNLQSCLRNKAALGHSGTYFIYVTRHFMTARIEADGSIWVNDNRTKTAVKLEDYRWKTVRIKRAWRVS